jgi:hypothetical protein
MLASVVMFKVAQAELNTCGGATRRPGKLSSFGIDLRTIAQRDI